MQIRAFNLKIAAILGLAVLCIFVGGLFYIGYFGDWHEPDCQTYPVQVVASPSGRLRAEQEQEACASTDQLRTRVQVTIPGRPEPVIAFLATTGQAMGAMQAGQRSVALGLRWEGEDQLVITHPDWVQSQLPAGIYGGVQVRLDPKPGGRK